MSNKKVRTVKKKKKGPSRFVRILISLVLLAGTVFMAMEIFKETAITYTLTADIMDAEQQIRNLERERQNLINQKEKLEDENYIRNYARGEFMITRDGEQIFHLPDNDEE